MAAKVEARASFLRCLLLMVEARASSLRFVCVVEFEAKVILALRLWTEGKRVFSLCFVLVAAVFEVRT